VQGDGQFTIHVMKPADRDKALAKRVKEVKNQSKMEHKLELEDQSKKDKSSKKDVKKSDKQDVKKSDKQDQKTPDKKDESKVNDTNAAE
ncbi:MAG: SpoIVB peptidase S55, partial [Veillonella dispar]|nr:SpoIVB peptidase S55 [Veillonella dispar]